MTLVLPTKDTFWDAGKVEASNRTKHLNQLGIEGWELVSIFAPNTVGGGTRDVVAVLKRPLA
jgi:hypothetical protein